MDQELKEYLDGRFQKTDQELKELAARFQRMDEQLDARFQRMVTVVGSEIGALHAEIRGVEQRLEQRFDSIDARLKLQAGLIQSGARAMARFSEFAENSEMRWVDLTSQMHDLAARVRKLEGAA